MNQKWEDGPYFGCFFLLFATLCYLDSPVFFNLFCGSVNSSEDVKSIPGIFGATLFLLSSVGFIISKLLV